MSYRVEINAESITELAGKLLALAATMQAAPADPVMEEVKAAPKPKKAKAAEPEVAERAPVDPTPAPEDAPAAPEAEPSKIADTTADAPAPSASEPLDFEKDVAPVVLGAVRDHGKPWVQDILSQFGFERASQVPEEQLSELVEVLLAGPQA